MKKRLIIPIIALMLVLVGCAENSQDTPEKDKTESTNTDGEENDNTYKFAYFMPNNSNPYYVTLSSGMKQAIEEKGGILEIYDAKTSQELQRQQVKEAIENGVDCAFITPVNWEEVTPALNDLKSSSVPIINVDSEVKEIDKVDAFVGSDNKKAGEIIGERLFYKNPNGGKILILESTSVNSINDRITGFEQSIINKGFEVVARENVSGDINTALEATKKVLSTDEEITSIVCGNDIMALGALVAAQSIGRTGLEIYGVDGSPDIKKELLKKNSQVVGTCAQTPAKIGRDSAKIGLAILNDEKHEERIYEDVFFIDAENVDMYGSDGWQ